eukprot:7109362-Prymnesium_polylepis.1
MEALFSASNGVAAGRLVSDTGGDRITARITVTGQHRLGQRGGPAQRRGPGPSAAAAASDSAP